MHAKAYWGEPERAPHYRESIPEILSVCLYRPTGVLTVNIITIASMTSSMNFRGLAEIDGKFRGLAEIDGSC